MSWAKRLARVFLGNAFSPASRGKGVGAPRSRRVLVEPLEGRRLLSVAAAGAGEFDFGDLPDNYGTTLVADGARHEAVGPTLGALRDAEADGLPTAGADGGADDDGVTFGTIQVGQLDATAMVNVQNAPSGAKLDAWIDFNGDGSFGGMGEQIADTVAVAEGDNVIEFDVPSWADPGEVYARFRLSSEGDLGPVGSAVDGEVEDYRLTISPAVAGGVFGPGQTISELRNDWRHGSPSLVAADINGDGHIDLLRGGQRFAWHENDGSGNFTEHRLNEDGAGEANVADINGDGVLDIIAWLRGGSLAWYENDGSENFTEHSILVDAGITSIFPADVNRDGAVDLVVTAHGSNRLQERKDVVWLENDGDGQFISHLISTANDQPDIAFATDLNGDGHIDVLYASWNELTIAWCENDGNENFVLHDFSAPVERYEFYMDVDAADINGDGHTDVLATVSSGDSDEDWIVWYENDGSGNLTRHTVFSARTYGYISVADIDGDGDLDVLSSSNRYDTVAWHENNGDGLFATHVLSTSAESFAGETLATDLDGDGDLDLVSWSDFQGGQWFENLGAFDFGDLPDSYGTTLASDGARHALTGPTLGATRDHEGDGQATAEASGDDLNGSDEDGVAFGVLTRGQADVSVIVNVQNAPGGAKLDAWIDFDGNGIFDPGDQIADSMDVVEGDNVLRFDVPASAVVGETYARFRLSSAGDLGPTGAADDGEVEDYRVVIASPVDLGEVDFVELADVNVAEGAKAYSFTTKYGGYLSVGVRPRSLSTELLTLELLDSEGSPVGELVNSPDGPRIDLADVAAGETYTLVATGTMTSVDLVICNLVEVDGTAVTVHGSEMDDQFGYEPGDEHGLSVNEVSYALDPSAVSSVHFACGGGDDTVSITGTESAETASFRPGGGSMTTTATGFTVSVEDARSVSLLGGGGKDVLEVIDGEGDDFFSMNPHHVTMLIQTDSPRLPRFEASQFGEIHAYAREGGNDTIWFSGSAETDRVKVDPDLVKMMKGNYFTRAKFFENVEVDTGTGADRAVITPSDGVDVLWAMKNDARIAQDLDLEEGQSPDFENMAYGVTILGCENLVARSRGGDDWIEVHDSALNDVLIAKPHGADMMNGPRDGVARGAEYRIVARGFRNVSAIADQGGDGDVAKLYDSGEDGVDIWAAAYVNGETWSSMSSPSRLLYEVLAFEQVGGYGFNGGLGENHGTNRREHGADVDFVFKYGYWEGDETPPVQNPRNPRGR